MIKKISTALYSPLIIQYRYNGNVAVVELPRQALNVEVPFSNEDAFNCFLAAADYYVKNNLLIATEVKNEKEIIKTAKNNKDEEVKKAHDAADNKFSAMKDSIPLKRGGVDLIVEKSEPIN